MARIVEQIEYEEVKDFSLLERALRSPRLNFPTIFTLSISALSISLALFHLYVAAFGSPETISFASVHLTAMLVLAIVLNPLFRKDISDPILEAGSPGNLKRMAGFLVDLVLVGLTLYIQVYILWDIEAFNMREGNLLPSDYFAGISMVVLVLESTRRAVGWAMVLITGFFIGQTLYSPHFFGVLYGPPTSPRKYIDVIFMRPDGIYGIPLMVAATYILLFIIFGALLIRSGAGRFFIDLAVALTGHRTGGPAKAAVVASALLGTVSGSSTANAVTTGSFTIPLMKKLGYRPQFAAAVEACASSGGQIMPPIMGAAAFIIAEFLRVSYLVVIVAAFLPAFLYFATVYFMVHLEAEKHGIEKVPKESLPDFLEVLKGGWHLLLSLAVLVAFLVVGYTPMLSAFWGVISIIVLSFVNKATRMSAVDMLAALESGVRSTAPVTVACACAGIIIGSVFASGLGLKFTQSVISFSGGYLILLLFFTALAAILLGMGITATAVYITVAALVVPALIKMGVYPMAAHMFAFYFGIVSSITPPVAITAFAAAAIAGSPPMATALESSKVGVAKYLIPFIFVYNPSLLFEGPLWLTVFSTVTVLGGVWALSAGLEGWCFGTLSPLMRLVILVGALALLVPPQVPFFGINGFLVTLVGAVWAGGFYVMRRMAYSAIAPVG